MTQESVKVNINGAMVPVVSVATGTPLTISQLDWIMPNAGTRAAQFLAPLQYTFQQFRINTPIRAAHFLAQIAHESGELRYVRELWGPNPTQQAYEGRRDLGNTEPGDGYFFLGRGLIQLTGRANYLRVSQALFSDSRLIDNPGILEQAQWAAASAGWFWLKNGLNELADTDIGFQGSQGLQGSQDTTEQALEHITRKINGGLNGLDARGRYLARALKVLVPLRTSEPAGSVVHGSGGSENDVPGGSQALGSVENYSDAGTAGQGA